MAINIQIQKKDLWLLSAIFVFLIGVGYVIAYGSGDPTVHGHDAGEIQGIGGGVSSCPSGTTQYGFWCMENSRRPAARFSTALNTCIQNGMDICPPDVISYCTTNGGPDCSAPNYEWITLGSSHLDNPAQCSVITSNVGSQTVGPRDCINSVAYRCCKPV